MIVLLMSVNKNKNKLVRVPAFKIKKKIQRVNQK